MTTVNLGLGCVLAPAFAAGLVAFFYLVFRLLR